jgi:uncharacterized protein (DUF58 family)
MSILAPAQAPAGIRHQAEALAAALPPLLAEARHLAAAVQLGAHGRRRAGAGDEFWQYRPAVAGDEARRIDWRRSARHDQHYLREQEWQVAQSVQMWPDASASMSYRSSDRLPMKRDRARILALAAAILLEEAGERIGLIDGVTPPRAGRAQLNRLAEALSGPEEPGDYGVPGASAILPGARVLFLSDFFGDPEALAGTVHAAADRGVSGALIQVIDPAEEDFPFTGRAIFESMGARLRHETREAGGLRDRYRERLAERRDRLTRLARGAGWAFTLHHTDAPPAEALLWIYNVLGRRR